MGKFYQIGLELLPLIYVQNGFNALSWAFFGQLSSKFVYELIFGRSGLRF